MRGRPRIRESALRRGDAFLRGAVFGGSDAGLRGALERWFGDEEGRGGSGGAQFVGEEGRERRWESLSEGSELGRHVGFVSGGRGWWSC